MADPLDIFGLERLALWLPTAYTNSMWEQVGTGTHSSHPTDDGDNLGTIEEPAGGFNVTVPSGSFPTLGSYDGKSAINFNDANNNRLIVGNSQSAFKFVHHEQDAHIAMYIKRVNIGAAMVLMQNSQGSSANVGFYFGFDSSNRLVASVSKATAGTQAVSITGPTLTDTTTEHLVEFRVAQGSNACWVRIDGGTKSTGTLAGTPADADATVDLVFGLIVSTTHYIGYMRDPIIVRGEITDAELVQYAAYSQSRTSAVLARPLASGNIDPDQHSNLVGWWRMTDATKLKQGSDGTTDVTTADDPVGYVEMMKTAPGGYSYNRNLTQATEASRPHWQTNQVNGLGCVVWEGAAADPAGDDYTGEEDLLVPGAPYGNATYILVYQNLESDTGSHVLSEGGVLPYITQTGDNYLGGARNDVVVHADNGAVGTIVVPGWGNMLNVLVFRRGYLDADASLNNTPPTADYGSTDNFGLARFSHMGRPSILGWDMNGPIAEAAIFNAKLTPNSVARLLPNMVERNGLENVLLGSGGSKRIGLSIGVGL